MPEKRLWNLYLEEEKIVWKKILNANISALTQYQHAPDATLGYGHRRVFLYYIRHVPYGTDNAQCADFRWTSGVYAGLLFLIGIYTWYGTHRMAQSLLSLDMQLEGEDLRLKLQSYYCSVLCFLMCCVLFRKFPQSFLTVQWIEWIKL